MTARSHKVQSDAPRPRQSEQDLKAAFHAIYRERSPYVWSTLVRLGVPPRHVADALQDVFLVVLRRLPEYEDRDALLGWLTAITQKVASDYRKKERKQPLASEPDMQQPDTSTDSEPAMAAIERVRLLIAAITDPDRRAIFTRHQLEGEPIPEIARSLNIPEGTASNRLRLAREEIKAAEKRLRAKEQRHEGAVVLPLFGTLDAEHTIPPMPEGIADEVWARLQRSPEYQQACGGSGGGGAEGEGTEGEASPGGHGAIALALAGGVALGLALGAFWNPLHRSPHAEAQPDTNTVTMAPAVLPGPSSAPTPSMPSSTLQPRSVIVSSAPRADPEAAEHTLIAHATRALASGDTATAIAQLQEHAKTYSSGRLAEERDAIWISALIRAGRLDEARDRLDRFADHYPTSGRLDSLRKALPPSP